MHGYFISLPLYDAAQHRERAVLAKVEQLAETRIRARKETNVKVNKLLAEKIQKEEERERRREERKLKRRAAKEQAEEDAMEVDEENAASGSEPKKEQEHEKEKEKEHEKPSLLTDPRFKALFENPDFQVDETTREFALLNPSTAAQQHNRATAGGKRTKTAVEEEEEESDKASSDGLSDSEEKESGEDSSEDSDVAGELWHDDIRARMAARDSGLRARPPPRRREPKVQFVPLQAKTDASGARLVDRNATFGQRRATLADAKGKRRASAHDADVRHTADGGMEVSFIPSQTRYDGEEMIGDDETPAGTRNPKGKEKAKRKGVESFGAGMERGDQYHPTGKAQRVLNGTHEPEFQQMQRLSYTLRISVITDISLEAVGVPAVDVRTGERARHTL
ncbi:predicted protein [Postia placenta Mad-698-R]|nr:predicted protein [Postia placenta Mad-698-R]